MDDINDANQQGGVMQAAKLKLVLEHFVSTYPCHEAGQKIM